LLIGSGEGSRLQVIVAGLLEQIGHRDVRVRLLPRLLLRGPQRPYLFSDQPVVLVGRTLPLCRTEEACREQRQDGLEDLRAAPLGAQDPSRLLHLAALLPTAVPTAPGRVLLHLLPGRTRTLGGKAIQRWPQVEEQLIDRLSAGIQQAQR